MRKHNILFCLFFPFSLLSKAQNENFEVKIIQDSVVIKSDKKNEIWLQKKPFKIQIELVNVEGIYLYASFNSNIIFMSKDKYDIPDFKNIPSKSMAEEAFNANQELIISKDGWAYWFYNAKENWHRMDKEVIVTDKSTTITKSIKQFFMYDSEDIVEMDKIYKPLYLFFLAAKGNTDLELSQELKRIKMYINWR
jgi:hypothetical protein